MPSTMISQTLFGRLTAIKLPNRNPVVSQYTGNQTQTTNDQQPTLGSNTVAVQTLISSICTRRALIASPIVSISLIALSHPSLARERRFKLNVPLEDYLTGPDGLKYYDIVEGKGPIAVKGSTIQVHFDCLYRGITAVSSRESKLLAGNRVIAQPYEFKVGSLPGRERKREFVDNPNGLFSAQAAPKPPSALYAIAEGMREGGRRTVIVPPELGYGERGSNEIPPGATFDLNIELLQVTPPEGSN